MTPPSGGDAGDATVVALRATPVDRRADQVVGEGIAGRNGPPRTRGPRLQRHALDLVIRVPGDVGDALDLVQDEIVHVLDVPEVFGFPAGPRVARSTATRMKRFCDEVA
jgi:hypothetical protein